MDAERRTVALRLALEYDGTAFHGWQIQPSHRSVQGELEAALRRISRGPVRVAGAGRTDAGCHAAGQVASVTLATRLEPPRIRAALNAILPEDVRVVEVVETAPGFHARFDAMRRAYRYLIVAPPSAIHRRRAWVRAVGAGVDALNAAAAPLVGRHDFTTFSKQGGDEAAPVCRVTRAVWRGRSGSLRFDIESDRFLYTMVRRIVATVVSAAESGGGAKSVRAALEAQSRRAAAPPAPPHGLYLMRVRYPRTGWIPKERSHVVA